MPSATETTNVTTMRLAKEVQLILLCCLLLAVDKSCKALRNVKYVSGNTTSDRRLSPFQIFLNKLALICDQQRGGNTVTALVALKGANGPAYHFASNHRQEEELIETKTFLTKLLSFVGTNPDRLAEKPIQKQVLWRILEFNYQRVVYYVRSVVNSSSECTAQRNEPVTPVPTSDMIKQLVNIGHKAQFSHEMLLGANAKTKFLKDCESLIKAIQAFKDGGFEKELADLANGANPDHALPWCELRHYFARLYAYRHAAEVIVAASREWPAVFTGFSVNYVPSARSPRFSIPKPTPLPEEMMPVAFPGMDLRNLQQHMEQLRDFGLNENIKEQIPQKPIKRVVHAEVRLYDFLVQNGLYDSEDYWKDTMFIATSKPPCRLCYHYFEIIDSEFEIQSPHMNTYMKWRLPDIYKEQELGVGDPSEALCRQQVLLETIVERMQNDVLHIINEKKPEGSTNDSRTGTRFGSSTMERHNNEERSYSHTSDRQSNRPIHPFGPLGSLVARIGSASGTDYLRNDEKEMDRGEVSTGKAL